jgi:hypothetical protein
MEKEKLIELYLSKKFEDQIKINKLILDIGMKLMHGYTANSQGRTPVEQDGLMLFQMTLMKSISILKLAEGIDFSSETGDLKLFKIYDPHTVLSIVRTQYEAFSNFNNIFIQSKTNDELLLKYYLWVKTGLKYRQKYNTEKSKKHIDTDVESKRVYYYIKEKKEKERIEIEDLKNKIRSNKCFLNLDKDSQELITKNWSREWKYKIDASVATKLNWVEIIKQSILNELIDDQYNYLSSNTHPSNVSVFQFAEMHEKSQDKDTMRVALMLSNFYLAFFISDFFQFYKMNELFKSLSNEQKIFLNAYNKLFREMN